MLGFQNHAHIGLSAIHRVVQTFVQRLNSSMCHTSIIFPLSTSTMLYFQPQPVGCHPMVLAMTPKDNAQNAMPQKENTLHLPRLPRRLSKYPKLALLGLVGVCAGVPTAGGIPILTSPILRNSPCSAIRTSAPGSRFNRSTPSG